jgi:SAM-dependent methyltransferase
MVKVLKKLLKEPALQALDQDHPDTTQLHRLLIQRKKALYTVYSRFYQKYKECAQQCPSGGLMVEIGSGGGFAKDFMPELITTDVLPLPSVDQVVDAHALPWEDASVSGIFMQNVLHHIPNSRAFFRQAARVLKPGGRVLMIEPYHSLLGGLIRKNFHHEPYDEHAADWQLPPGGPLSMSNLALPWIIFCRDIALFEKEFPEFEVRLRRHTMISYFITGGITYRSLIPAGLMPLLLRVERLLSPLNPWMAYFFDIELIRRAG